MALSAESVRCRIPWENSLHLLEAKNTPYEDRTAQAECLMNHHFDQPAVARTILGIIRDTEEEILLREDLMTYLAHVNLRRNEKLEGKLTPEVGNLERKAINRALASAGDILAVTSAVKVMNDTVTMNNFEPEFIRALNAIALDQSSHVILRATAVESLERLLRNIVISGLYSEKLVRISYENLRMLAMREDGYYAGADRSIQQLESDSTFMLALENKKNSERVISSEK